MTDKNIQQTTLVLLFNQDREILLGQKKRGFGKGFRNGFGGKIHEGETILEAAIRELEEEAKVVFDSNLLKKRGEILFEFCQDPVRYQSMHVFVGDYDGGFEETDEMRPQWWSIDKLPYDQMWQDDQYWFPRLLAGEYVEDHFVFDRENNLLPGV